MRKIFTFVPTTEKPAEKSSTPFSQEITDNIQTTQGVVCARNTKKPRLTSNIVGELESNHQRNRLTIDDTLHNISNESDCAEQVSAIKNLGGEVALGSLRRNECKSNEDFIEPKSNASTSFQLRSGFLNSFANVQAASEDINHQTKKPRLQGSEVNRCRDFAENIDECLQKFTYEYDCGPRRVKLKFETFGEDDEDIELNAIQSIFGDESLVGPCARK